VDHRIAAIEEWVSALERRTNNLPSLGGTHMTMPSMALQSVPARWDINSGPVLPTHRWALRRARSSLREFRAVV